VDFLNVMTYDFNGAWDIQTGVNSPLYPRADETGVGFDGSERSTLNLVCAKKFIYIYNSLASLITDSFLNATPTQTGRHTSGAEALGQTH